MEKVLSPDFVEQLQFFQDKFSEYFDVAAIIVDDDGIQITEPSSFSDFCLMIRSTEKGLRLCTNSKKKLYSKIADGKPSHHTCAIFSELADDIVPVMWNERVVGAWAVGQKRIRPISRKRLDEVAADIGLDPEEFHNAYLKLPATDPVEFRKIVYFLHTTISTIMKMREQDNTLKNNLEKFNRITGIVAHDLRESLSIIIGYTTLLGDRYGSDGEEEFIKFVGYITEYSSKLKETMGILIDMCEAERT